MIRIKIVSIFIFSIFFASIAKAQYKTYVVCAQKSNRSNWYWARDKNGNYIEVTGYYMYGRCGDINFNRYVFPRNSHRMFFVLDPQYVDIAKLACPSNFYFQPANSSQDIWYLFAEGKNDNIEKKFNGHIQCFKGFDF